MLLNLAKSLVGGGASLFSKGTAWLGKGDKAAGAWKLKKAAGYIGVSQGLSYAVGKQQEFDKAYYGKERTDYYGKLRTGIEFMGAAHAAGSFFGADALSMLNPRNPKRLAVSAVSAVAGVPLMMGGAWAAQYGYDSSMYKASLGIIGAGAVLGVAGGLSRFQGFSGGLKATGLGMAAMGAGVYAGATTPVTPVAEGRISSIETGRTPSVSRMNFSTAGLTLALHKNRRLS